MSSARRPAFVADVVQGAGTVVGAIIQSLFGAVAPQGGPATPGPSSPATTAVIPSASTPAPSSTPTTPAGDRATPASAGAPPSAPSQALPAKLATRYLSDMDLANPGDSLAGPRSIGKVTFGHSVAAGGRWL